MVTEDKKILHQLKIARGQVDGIIKMVENDHYCIDVLTQLAASDKVLKRAASLLMERHLLSCIKAAKDKDDKTFDKKINELIKAFRTFL